MVILGKYGFRRQEFEEKFEVRISTNMGPGKKDPPGPPMVLIKAKSELHLDRARKAMTKLLFDQSNTKKFPT